MVIFYALPILEVSSSEDIKQSEFAREPVHFYADKQEQ